MECSVKYTIVWWSFTVWPHYPFYPIDCFEECSYLEKNKTKQKKKKKKKKKRSSCSFLLSHFGSLFSLFGDNLLASWSKHCVSYSPFYNLPQLQLAPLSPIEACFRCWNSVLTIIKLWPCIFFFFLSFFGYSLIRTLDNVTNYNTCSQRKRVWSDVFKQSPVCI